MSSRTRTGGAGRRGRGRVGALLGLGAVAIATAVVLSGCSGSPSASRASSVSSTDAVALRAPAHVVIVVLENHSYRQVVEEPYLAALERRSAVLTNSHAITHPSEPNYLALWSGSTQGLRDDSCPHSYSTDSLGAQLIRAGMSVTGYFESMPSAGYTGCTAGAYARRHNPLADFPATAGPAHNRPLTSYPSRDLRALPRVSLVVPNLNDDMHDGSVRTGDAWLRDHIDPYARWARSHDSLLIVTWDENDDQPGNRILTLVTGQHVRPGRYDQRVTHRSVLHTVEKALGLPLLGPAATPLHGIWR